MSGALALGRASRCCACANAAVELRAKARSKRAEHLSVRRQGIVRDSLAPRKRTSVVAKAAAVYYETAPPDHANQCSAQARAPDSHAAAKLENRAESVFIIASWAESG